MANSYNKNDIVVLDDSLPAVKKIAACATKLSPVNSKIFE